MIELNKKKLIPEKELDNVLKNLKNAHKTVYHKSLKGYLDSKKDLLTSAGIGKKA